MKANEWQPIETAPKTGQVLVWMGGAVRIAWWNDQKHSHNPRPYWVSLGYNGTAEDRASQPKWWMPLPAGPQEETKAGGAE